MRDQEAFVAEEPSSDPVDAGHGEASASWQTGDASGVPAVHGGTDQAGAVVVTVDSGGRVVSVEIAASWRELIGHHSLADTVRDAIADAADRNAAAWAITTAERVHEPADAAALAMTRDLATELRHAHHLLDAVAATIAGHPEPHCTATGPAGAATVTLDPSTGTPASIAAITINGAWLADRDHQTIADELTAAFGAVYQAADRAKARSRAWVTPIDRIHQALQAADTAMQHLGLAPSNLDGEDGNAGTARAHR